MNSRTREMIAGFYFYIFIMTGLDPVIFFAGSKKDARV
jgi:hypothetical protein